MHNDRGGLLNPSPSGVFVPESGEALDRWLWRFRRQQAVTCSQRVLRCKGGGVSRGLDTNQILWNTPLKWGNIVYMMFFSAFGRAIVRSTRP